MKSLGLGKERERERGRERKREQLTEQSDGTSAYETQQSEEKSATGVAETLARHRPGFHGRLEKAIGRRP